jgi:hypothetical protein
MCVRKMTTGADGSPQAHSTGDEQLPESNIQNRCFLFQNMHLCGSLES